MYKAGKSYITIVIDDFINCTCFNIILIKQLKTFLHSLLEQY